MTSHNLDITSTFHIDNKPSSAQKAAWKELWQRLLIIEPAPLATESQPTDSRGALSQE